MGYPKDFHDAPSHTGIYSYYSTGSIYDYTSSVMEVPDSGIDTKKIV